MGRKKTWTKEKKHDNPINSHGLQKKDFPYEGCKIWGIQSPFWYKSILQQFRTTNVAKAC
jgi:hypothetical protein